MPSMKDLRNRIRSVRSTQQITAAMKVVAASRLRRAQEADEAARPYTYRMGRVLASLASGMAGRPEALPLLAGTGKDDVHCCRAGADSDQAAKLVGMVGKERDQQGREQRHPGATTPVPGIPFERSTKPAIGQPILASMLKLHITTPFSSPCPPSGPPPKMKPETAISRAASSRSVRALAG